MDSKSQPSDARSEHVRPPRAELETAVVAPSTDGTADAARRPVSGIGAAVGRYLVLEEVGRGGMGRVVRAYDPKLQREVALKELRAATLGTEGTRRLVAEARAMAKLSHPNVVAVYDVEELGGGQVVLVMEYVAGDTLDAWVRAGRRPWSEVVARYLAAGRGLAAAHAAGLLHRDFKPSNVLVAEGAVKVTDFGLAKLGEGADGSVPPAPSVGDLVDGEPLSGLTEAGTVMGTPRYMAPEQHRGDPLTAAADQYGFCVALWEALTGGSPFSGDLHALAAAKQRGPPPWPGGPTPRPIVTAIVRGLSPEPATRWPSMDALLTALSFDPARRRTRWLAAVGAVALVGAGAAGLRTWSASRARPCTSAEAQLVDVWDEPRREAVQAAIVGTDASYADGVWARVSAALDDYAAGWVAMHTDACLATTVRGEQSAAVMDLRMGCLHRARVELGAATAVLADADVAVVGRAHELVAGLPPLSRCADIEALKADVEPPLPEDAPAVGALRARLAAARADREAGRYEDALTKIEAIAEEVTEVAYGPVHTEVQLERGFILDALGRFDEAEAALHRTVELASRWHQRGELADAATHILFVIGAREGRFDAALQYRALVTGLVDGQLDRQGALHNNISAVLRGQGKYEDAVAEERRALVLWEQSLSPRSPILAAAYNNLATALFLQQRYDEAEVEQRRALERWEVALGPDHPDVAKSQLNLAVGLYTRGKYAEAEAELRQAVPKLAAAVGADHPDVAQARNNLAVVLRTQGKLEEAETVQRRALAGAEAALGPEHPAVAHSRNNLAVLLRARGKYDEAEAEFRGALAAREATLGPDHPDVAASLHDLADLMLERGDAAAARELAERAWHRRERDDIPPKARAETAFVLARALDESDDPGDRRRAIRLARIAATAFEDAGPAGEPGAASVRAWLAAHAAG